MEWLGDDLKKVETQDGVTEEETVQAMEALAKLHATFWNTPEPRLSRPVSRRRSPWR